MQNSYLEILECEPQGWFKKKSLKLSEFTTEERLEAAAYTITDKRGSLLLLPVTGNNIFQLPSFVGNCLRLTSLDQQSTTNGTLKICLGCTLECLAIRL